MHRCTVNISLAAAAVVFCAAPARASPLLTQALGDLRQSKWGEAKITLTAQLGKGGDSIVYYLLGYADAQLKEIKLTLDEETKALASQPVLSDPYRSGAVQLLRWAASESRRPIFHVHLEQSVVSEQDQQAQDAAIEKEEREIAGLIERATKVDKGVAYAGFGRFGSCHANPVPPYYSQLTRNCLVEASAPVDPLPTITLPED